MGEKMKKTTITLLAVAGVFALTGCKHEVMHDRQYDPAGPQEDPGMKQPAHRPAPAAPAPLAPVEDQGGKKSQASVQELRYQPMGGEFSNDGIADDAAPRKRSGKSAEGRKKVKGGSDAGAARGGVYIVKPGDTLGKIAARNKVSLNALREANNLDPKRDKFLRIGTKLVIPGGKSAAGKSSGRKAVVRKGGKNTPKLNSDGTYTMVRGDSIPKVARKFGVRAKALQRANNLTDEETTRLQIGHKLIIPTGDDAVIRKGNGQKARKAAKKPAVKKVEAKEDAVLPPPPAVAADNARTLPPPPPAAATAVPAADSNAAAMPPAAPVDSVNAVESSNFVAAGDAKTLAEFAAKHNTTVEELCKLNPQIDPAAQLEPNKMLFVPKK